MFVEIAGCWLRVRSGLSKQGSDSRENEMYAKDEMVWFSIGFWCLEKRRASPTKSPDVLLVPGPFGRDLKFRDLCCSFGLQTICF